MYTVCRCDIEERYLFNDIFSSYIFIWFARRPLVITLLSLLLSLDFIFIFVVLLNSSRSPFFIVSFAFVRFILAVAENLSFRIRFLGDGFLFCHLQCCQCSWTYTIFVRHEWRFLIERTNERARNETWFESNVRLIYFAFWFHGETISPAEAAASQHTRPYQIWSR